MRKLRMALTAALTASMVLATTGAAFAQSSSSWESRADFILQLDKALGIKPVYPATPDFQDVSTTSPYYGYIEAAYQDGITNGIAPGIFGPSLGITRAEAAKYLVIAFGSGSAAKGITSTSFSDNGDIPTALVGYVGEAVALGLMKGFPGGTFNPDGNLTVTQEGYLLSQLTTAMSSLTLKVTASSSDVAPGQPVTLSTTGTTASGAAVASPIVTYSVTGTNASEALLSGSTFVGTTAGHYTVQAASGTSTATTTVSVYGTAVGLKVNAPTSVVANGASTVTVTVDVVDANGNTVGGNTDMIALNDGGGAVAAFGTAPSTVTAVNGVATFTLTAGTIAGAVETLTASDTTPGSALTTGTATISGAAQVPTSLSVTPASPYLTSNQSNGSDVLSAMVLDQTGNAMVSGAYTVSFAVTSGPANFAGSATAAGVYYGPTPASATATLNDVQGSTGAIVVTASATGLTSGTANLTSVIAGTPSQIALSAAQTVAAGTSATYTVTLEDSHGYPSVPAQGSPVTVDVTDSSTSAVSPLTIAYPSDAASFTVKDTVAGSYTLTAADAAGALTSATSTETVTAGTLVGVYVTPQDAANGVYTMAVPVGSPTFTASVQLVDGYNNPIAEAGVEVQVLLGAAGLSPSPNIGSATVTAGAATATSKPGGPNRTSAITTYTNSSGVATASIVMQPYVGDVYYVIATAVSGGQTYGGHTNTPWMLLTQGTTAGSTLTVKDGTAPTSNVVSSMVSGTTYYGTITQTDAAGNPAAPGDTLLVTLGGTGTASLGDVGANVNVNAFGSSGTEWTVAPASGAYSFTIDPQLAGPLTISMQDLDVYNATTTTGTFSVTPGTDVVHLAFSTSGTAISATAPLSVIAGTAYPITVTATDAGGNPIVAASTVPVVLTAAGTAASGAEYRLGSASGANETTPRMTVNIPAGQLSTTFYFVPTASGTVSFDSSAIMMLVLPNLPVVGALGSGNGTRVSVSYRATDINGVGVPGVAVTFNDAGAGGSFSPTTAITDANGDATVTYTTPGSGSPSTVLVDGTVQGIAAIPLMPIMVNY